MVLFQFPFDAEDEIDLGLDMLGAALCIPEFLTSYAKDCLTKVRVEKKE